MKATRMGRLHCFKVGNSTFRIRSYSINLLNPRSYLLLPALIIAQRKPMVAVAESWAMKRRVPGESQ